MGFHSVSLKTGKISATGNFKFSHYTQSQLSPFFYICPNKIVFVLLIRIKVLVLIRINIQIKTNLLG